MKGFKEREERSRDDRPREKKSWREIDKARESGQQRREREDRDRQAGIGQGNSTAYEKYKKNLERLWTQGGGKLMDLVAEKNGGAPVAEAEPVESEPQRAVIKRSAEDRQKERATRDALLKAATPAETKAAAQAFIDARPALPNDVELLMKILGSPTEAHQVAALRLLSARDDLATLPNARLLKGRLQTILLTAGEDETRQHANSIRDRLP